MRPKRYAGSVFGVTEAPEEAQTLRWQRFRRFRVVGEAPRKRPKRVPAHPRPKKVTFQINFKRRIDFFGPPDFSKFLGWLGEAIKRCPKQAKRYAESVFLASVTGADAKTLR